MKNPKRFHVRRRLICKAKFPAEIYARTFVARYRRYRKGKPGPRTEVEAFVRIGDADNGERIAVYKLVRVGTIQKHAELK